jgi:D-3-phosphoglycerate dehydrogenase
MFAVKSTVRPIRQSGQSDKSESMSEVSYPKEKINILLLENVSAGAVSAFHEAGYTAVRALKSALSEDDLIAQMQDVHILGIRSKTRLTDKAIGAAPRLLAVGCFCIGTNQVDKAAATEQGVVVFNAPYSNTRSVAELVIGAAIMLIRRIPDKHKAAHEGIWLKESAACHELRGKTLGIIGYGNIGSQVSVLAEALGMHILYYDIEKKLPLGNARPMPDMESVLSAADVVTLHVPFTSLTANLINSESLAHCKPGALLINYARGEVADIAAIAAALRDGRLGGAAVDVYPEEPEANGQQFTTPLQGLSNVLLTPHIGGSTEEAQASIGQDVSSKLISFIERGSTQGSLTVPPLSLPLQEGAHRILHIHHNRPGVLSGINSQLAAAGINILGQYLKTNDRIGYVVLDVDRRLSTEAVALLRAVPETIRVRVVY